MLKALYLSYENASYNKITKKYYIKPSIIAIIATILYRAISSKK
jgi:hypothetical protein